MSSTNNNTLHSSNKGNILFSTSAVHSSVTHWSDKKFTNKHQKSPSNNAHTSFCGSFNANIVEEAFYSSLDSPFILIIVQNCTNTRSSFPPSSCFKAVSNIGCLLNPTRPLADSTSTVKAIRQNIAACACQPDNQPESRSNSSSGCLTKERTFAAASVSMFCHCYFMRRCGRLNRRAEQEFFYDAN